MGFPVCYTQLFIPTFILHILTLLGFIHNLFSTIFHFIRLQHDSPSLREQQLPVVNFSELVDPPPDKCIVCLYEFEATDEIRVLSNCKHVFHKCCIDKWMGHGHKTCPLCRLPFVTKGLKDSFDERLRTASGIEDYYGDSSLVGSS
ncbi:putative transcription factor C2H2 family [Helianthus debilis subsp. tardiflorus]